MPEANCPSCAEPLYGQYCSRCGLDSKVLVPSATGQTPAVGDTRIQHVSAEAITNVSAGSRAGDIAAGKKSKIVKKNKTIVNAAGTPERPETHRVAVKRHAVTRFWAALVGLVSLISGLITLVGVFRSSFPGAESAWTARNGVFEGPDIWFIVGFLLLVVAVALMVTWWKLRGAEGYMHLWRGRMLMASGPRGRLQTFRVEGECPECRGPLKLRRVAVGVTECVDAEGQRTLKTKRDWRLTCDRNRKLHVFEFDVTKMRP